MIMHVEIQRLLTALTTVLLHVNLVVIIISLMYLNKKNLELINLGI